MENSLPDVVFLAAGDDMLKNNSIDCETKNAAESLNVVKKQPYVCDKCDRAYSVKRELTEQKFIADFQKGVYFEGSVDRCR
ncbi:hypothetical protein T4E_11097 [Trichinella pseudospiralis]|uniref:Uncharacterized protein n=1 Tax=Trichinella pseudospiralis TaxID=6337 RepID=A0A0V0YCM1_TRIPS|nr:hypothetical protein T4E_11097 [Trichinella pseudospiralis]